jgi:hypothetical protein
MYNEIDFIVHPTAVQSSSCSRWSKRAQLYSKWYFVNVERGNIAEKLQPRNINVSFTNNSNVAIDILIFTFYSDQLVIDVEIVIVHKYIFIILL